MTSTRLQKKGKRKLHVTAEKIGYSKESNDPQNQKAESEFTSHCQIASKTNFLMLFPAHFAHARYSSRMIDRFLNWGDHGKPKSGKIKGRYKPPGTVRFSKLKAKRNRDEEKLLTSRFAQLRAKLQTAYSEDHKAELERIKIKLSDFQTEKNT